MTLPVIPAHPPVIPAKAGIQGWRGLSLQTRDRLMISGSNATTPQKARTN